MMERILNKYGTTVLLYHGNEIWKLQVFFQPVRSQSWENSDADYSPLGEVSRGRYVYIGPLEPELAAGDTVVLAEKSYQVRRSEVIRDHRGPLYCWGLCLEKGGEDAWGKQS